VTTRGDRNIAWIEHYCRIPEGRFVGQPVKLREFQREVIRGIYDSPTRRAIISFGRKNAKTTLSAFLLLLHLCGPEARENSQLYSAAQSRDQAALLFNLAAKVVRLSPDLNAVVLIRDTAKQLACPELGTLYRALSAEASTAYGLSPVFTVHDELGQVQGPRSDLYEALETASGAQDEPLSIVISTQAAEDADLLSVLIDDAKGGHDPRVKLFLWTAPDDLDPFGDEAISAANPAYGDFLNPREVRDQAEAARRMPAREASYRNLVLNQRVNVVNPFMARAVWSVAARDYGLDRFAGLPCWVGLDLSSTTDTTAAVAVFRADDRFWCWPWFWLPQEGLAEKARTDRVPYDVWARDGHLLTLPGKALDHLQLIRQALDLLGSFDVRAVAYDRWGLNFLRPQLEREGLSLPLVEFGQGFQSMSPALAKLETELLNGTLHHPGHPMLTSHAANAVVRMDPAGNRKLDKSKATGRIDGMVALTMALSACNVETKPAGKSFWDQD